VQDLEKIGADFIVIPCNTVHHFIKEMQESINVPILSIIEETKKEILAQNISHVGILASKTTIDLGLYNFKGIMVSSPNFFQQNKINGVIKAVMGGSHNNFHKNELNQIINNYVENGVGAVVLGCTELPLAINQTHTKTKLFSTIDILALSTLKEAYKQLCRTN